MDGDRTQSKTKQLSLSIHDSQEKELKADIKSPET